MERYMSDLVEELGEYCMEKMRKWIRVIASAAVTLILTDRYAVLPFYILYSRCDDIGQCRSVLFP